MVAKRTAFVVKELLLALLCLFGLSAPGAEGTIPSMKEWGARRACFMPLSILRVQWRRLHVTSPLTLTCLTSIDDRVVRHTGVRDGEVLLALHQRLHEVEVRLQQEAVGLL